MKCYRSGGCGPYEMLACNECPASREDYLKKTYTAIKENIESTWPDWKIKLANETLLTSAHCKKLNIKKRGSQ